MEREDLIAQVRKEGRDGRLLVWGIALAFAVILATIATVGGDLGFTFATIEEASTWPERGWAIFVALPTFALVTIGAYQFERLHAHFQKGEILTPKTTQRIRWIAFLLLADGLLTFADTYLLPGVLWFLGFADELQVTLVLEPLFIGIGAWTIAKVLALGADLQEEASRTV